MILKKFIMTVTDRLVVERISYVEELLDVKILPLDQMSVNVDPKDTTGFNYDTMEYVCGHCDKPTSGFIISSHRTLDVKWLICLNCKKGSVHDNGIVYPQPLLGQYVEGLPDTIKTVYEEARKSFSSNSHTACELVCRKILMNVSVQKGADEGEDFVFYIDHLEKSGYITPPMKKWVDIIRQNGNQSNHEIKTPDPERAENTLAFTAQLLKLIYETEYYTNKHNKKSGT